MSVSQTPKAWTSSLRRPSVLNHTIIIPLLFSSHPPFRFPTTQISTRGPVSASPAAPIGNSTTPIRSGLYTVGEFMTKKEELHVVKPTTTVDEALEALVEHRITGFPVIDDNWKLVGVVSDYDLLALDSISGSSQTDTSMFPEVVSTWKTFNEVQTLLSKTNGQVVGDVNNGQVLFVNRPTLKMLQDYC